MARRATVVAERTDNYDTLYHLLQGRYHPAVAAILALDELHGITRRKARPRQHTPELEQAA